MWVADFIECTLVGQAGMSGKRLRQPAGYEVNHTLLCAQSTHAIDEVVLCCPQRSNEPFLLFPYGLLLSPHCSFNLGYFPLNGGLPFTWTTTWFKNDHRLALPQTVCPLVRCYHKRICRSSPSTYVEGPSNMASVIALETCIDYLAKELIIRSLATCGNVRRSLAVTVMYVCLVLTSFRYLSRTYFDGTVLTFFWVRMVSACRHTILLNSNK